ncbi:unnamed protein product, partial [Musa textilis]
VPTTNQLLFLQVLRDLHEVAARLTLCGRVCRKGASRLRQSKLSPIEVGAKAVLDLANFS